MLSLITVIGLQIFANLPQNLNTGDLIFLDLNCGKLCDAIEDATLEQFSVPGPRLSHVGIISVDPKNKSVSVIEAWPDGGVKKTPLTRVLKRVSDKEDQPGGYIIGRTKESYRSFAKQAAQRAMQYIGRPYDDLFFMDSQKLYCSELVYDAWKGLPTKEPIFKTRPMFFGDPISTSFVVWEQYYESYGISPPTGEMGISPLGVYFAGKRSLFK